MSKELDMTVVEKLTPELKELVLSKDGYQVYEGKNPDKPVVRDPAGKLVKGTGIEKRHIDMGEMSKQFAYKRRKSYREALETIVDADGPPEQEGTFLWWLRQAQEAAKGAVQEVACPECRHKFEVKGKRDGGLIFKIIELVHGKATETREVSYRDETMEAILNQRSVDPSLKVWGEAENQAARQAIIELE